MAPTDDRFSYSAETEVFFVGNFANTTFDTKQKIDRAFADSLRYWKTHCGGKSVYCVIDYTGTFIDPKLTEYFGARRNIIAKYMTTTVRFGANPGTRATLRSLAITTHSPSNLYESRQEAIAVVERIRRGEVQIARAAP
jgi:hypothetical protein